MRALCFLVLSFALIHWDVTAQSDMIDDNTANVTYGAAPVSVFNGAENISFRLNYYHTDGYSTSDRYWYEVIVLDSLMILNFKSPDNDDWNYVSYQKQVVLSDSVLIKIKSLVKSLGIKQKREGIPLPEGSGYGADRLFIETDNLRVAGGTVYMNVGLDDSKEEFLARIKKEKQLSTSISGDYEVLFSELEKFFPALPILLTDKDKN